MLHYAKVYKYFNSRGRGITCDNDVVSLSKIHPESNGITIFWKKVHTENDEKLCGVWMWIKSKNRKSIIQRPVNKLF